MPRAATLMVQGTSSDAGKSTLVTGLCRVFRRRGVDVAPFKPQNMALNSAVTVDGGEIGRAQAVQAMACGLAPHSDMNPVLLKPNSDTGAQVIIGGHVVTDLDAAGYHAYKPVAMRAVLAAWERLSARHALVLVEGAGSPAEVNLRAGDIANMGFAEAVDCPVILVADIDRGGVFAQIVGTLELLAESERARVRGFVINRFRGDPRLLEPGLRWLQERTARPVLGVLPYMDDLHLEAEDALPAGAAPTPGLTGGLRVVVPALPRISNHTDTDALRLHPRVAVRFVRSGAALQPADLVLLPGSKSVCADLVWLRERGFADAITRHLRYGGRVLGLCGGFQMLGRVVCDPRGVEGTLREAEGLGLLDMRTVLGPEKRLAEVAGVLAADGARVRGYEIHMGSSSGPALERPLLLLEGGPDGAITRDGQVAGCYMHGLFDHAEACAALLAWAGLPQDGARGYDYEALRERGLERLADAVEAHLDVAALEGSVADWPRPAAG